MHVGIRALHWKLRVALFFAILAAVIGILLLSAPPPEHFDLVSHSEPRYGAEGSDPSMLVIQGDDGKYGYGDAQGRVVIKPQYDQASPFFDGLAAVQKGWRWGYIDKTGKTVIPFRYYDAGDFHNGKAFVGVSLIKHFSSMPALMQSRLIDRTGSTARETPYTDVVFADGGYIAQGDSIDYLDADCNVLITDRAWSQYRHFHEGVFLREYSGDGQKLYIFEDRSGRGVAMGFTGAKDFSGGMAAVQTYSNGNHWGYIDRAGKMAIDPAYREAFPFGDGLALIKDTGGAAVIDTAGRVIARAQSEFDTAKAFSEGLCAIGKLKPSDEIPTTFGIGHRFDPDETYIWGFMDASGKIAVYCRYDRVSAFKNGVAEVLLDGKIGYIDKAGNYIWEPK